MKDKIIEIGEKLRYQMQAVQYAIDHSGMSKTDLRAHWNDLSAIATRIDSLYSEGMSEDEVDRAYMRWYFGSDDYVIPNPNEPINNTFYAQLNTWRNCVEWYKPHPTPEISEDFKDKIKTLIGYLKIWNRSGRMCFPPPELNGVIEEADVWIKELNDK